MIPPHTPLKEVLEHVARVEHRLLDAAQDVRALVGIVRGLHHKIESLNGLVAEERKLRMARKANMFPGRQLRKEAKDGQVKDG